MHHVPGRFRVCVPAVKGCSDHARALERSLAGVRGVRQVECRTVTGSVIVNYDPCTADAAALLRSLGAEALAGKRATVRSRSNQIAAKAAEGIFWFALEKAAERALPLLLAAVL